MTDQANAELNAIEDSDDEGTGKKKKGGHEYVSSADGSMVSSQQQVKAQGSERAADSMRTGQASITDKLTDGKHGSMTSSHIVDERN